MRKKGKRYDDGVPFDFELLPGLTITSGKDKAIGDNGQEKKIGQSGVRLCAAFYHALQKSEPGRVISLTWEELGDVLYEDSSKKPKTPEKIKAGVQRAVSNLRCNIREVYHDENIIQYSRSRERYWIAPVSVPRTKAQQQKS